ncbi:serine hydrolase [Streptomyces sp. NPDC002962]|uniref:serine hydrolase n=1 Tax=Streptomyces sp. NPDC002962 TaxID=3364674 RepID=UPI00367B95D2
MAVVVLARAITSKTVFDMASNSKQFTADAVLLLAGRHRLAVNDPLSDYLDDPPAWARDITLVASAEPHCSPVSRTER